MASGRLLICVYSSWGFWHVRCTYANTEKHTNQGGAEARTEKAKKKPSTYLQAD